MTFPIPNPKSYSTYLSLLLGMGLWYFFYIYLSRGIISPVSMRVVFFSILASFSGVVGYFLLLELWVIPRLSEMPLRQRWLLIGWSTCVGIFLVFAGTNIWGVSPEYITFLLPQESLKITVLPVQNSKESTVAILWFTTSLGDISNETISYHGWKNIDNRLVLRDLKDNSFEWTGRTGEQAILVFRKSPLGGTINVAWNGRSETINLFSETGQKYSYIYDFQIPFYASRNWAFLLIILDFSVLACAIYLLVFAKRKVILDHLMQSIATISYELGDKIQGRVERGTSRKYDLPDWLVIAGIMSAAMLLRGFHLENLYPYADEYVHLIAAKTLLNGAAINEVYQRSLFMVSLPVAFSFQMLGASLSTARIVGVLFNVLAILPLYWITKKINKPIAVLSCLLYATNPWIISVSRNVREYAYHPFYFYWIIYGMVVFLERFPNRFVITKDWRRIYKPEIGLLGIALLFPPLYCFLIDPLSSSKLILIAYGVFCLFILAKFDFTNKRNVLLLAVVSSGIAISIFLYLSNQSTVRIFPNFDGQAFGYFFSNPKQQWFFNRLVIIPVFGFTGAVMISLLFGRKNFIPLFFITLFLVYMLFFVFFFARYIKPRYIIVAQYWYIVAMAVGVYGVWALLKSLYAGSHRIMPLAVAVLLILTMNVPQIILPTVYDSQGYMPITEEYHYRLDLVHSFLLKNVGDNDVLISTIYGNYTRWIGNPTFETIYFYHNEDNKATERISSIVQQHDSGWLVLDRYRYDRTKPLPRSTVEIGSKRLEYIGAFADEYVWRWSINGVSD